MATTTDQRTALRHAQHHADEANAWTSTGEQAWKDGSGDGTLVGAAIMAIAHATTSAAWTAIATATHEGRE
jgi:hypothetical protein